MLAFLRWLLSYVPLPILDARISAAQKHMLVANLTTATRLVLLKQLQADMAARYHLLEDIED